MSAARFSSWVTPASLGVLAVALVYGRFLVEARGDVRAAEAASAHGDAAEATRCYLDALRAYVPGSPYERRALDGLGALAAEAASAGDPDAERRAWEAMRRGLLGTRSLYVPHRERLASANRRIAELDAAVPVAPDPVVVHRRGPRGARIGSSPFAEAASTLVALVGFALWVGAIVLLIRRGLDESSGPARRPPAPATSAGVSPGTSAMVGALVPIMFVVGFALFLGGLRFP